MAGSEKQTKLKKRAYGENKLTDKERAFCYAYVKDYNVAGAARVAGYSEKTAKNMGHKLIAKANVISLIGKLQHQAFKDVDLSLPAILQQLAHAVTRNLDDFCDEEGFLVVDPRKMTARAKTVLMALRLNSI